MSKKKKNIKSNIVRNEKLISRLRMILLAALMVIVFYPPYLQGLYFEKHVLPTQIFVFIVFIVFLIYKWLKKDYQFFKTPIGYIAIGFVAVYFISIFVAVHTRSAIIEWLKYCMYFAVFYMITDLADNIKTKLIILWTIVISATGSSILGLDAAMGGNLVGFLNKVFRFLGAENDVFFGLFVGNRIHSTLQYPNAMASYVMAVFFIVAGLLIVTKKIWQKAILGGFGFILFLTLMLTLSRGVQFLFPVALIIFFVAAQKGTRIKSITQLLMLAIPAAMISLLINPNLSADILNKNAIFLVLAGVMVTAILGIVSEHVGNLLQKVNWKIYVTVFSVFLIITIISIIHIVNASAPLELAHSTEEENKTITSSKSVALKPDKEYILSFMADARMETEQNYAYFIRLYSLNQENIFFGGSKQLLRENLLETDGMAEKRIQFTTPEDSKLIRVSFSNYYSGTSVVLDDVKIVDAETGKTVKKVIFKNKYNLDNILTRFQNIWLSNSLISRTIFYQDGIEIFGRSWLLGSGGGAWDYLYRQYQSYNYASSQAHNFQLQLGIETGILGLIVLLCLIFIILYSFIKYYKKVNGMDIKSEGTDKVNPSTTIITASIVTAIAALLIHSFIDFDFSEPAIMLLFWQLIAIFNRTVQDNLELAEILPFSIHSTSAKKYGKNNITGRKWAISAAIMVTATILVFVSCFEISSSQARKAYELLRENEVEDAIDSMNKAIHSDAFNEEYVIGFNPAPSRPDIKTGLVDLLFLKNEMIQAKKQRGDNISEDEIRLLQQQFSVANQKIMKIEKKAENNLKLTSNLASYSFRTGQVEKGIEYLDKAIALYPFEPSIWHSKLDIYYQLMKEKFNAVDYESTEKYIDAAFDVITKAKNINKENMDPFILNNDTVELLQRMQFIKEYLDDVSALKQVNEIVHYTLPTLDVNHDNIPDQWLVSNTDLLDLSTSEEGMNIKATGRTYINARYPIKFEQGKTYRIELKMKEPVEYLKYYISGIQSATSFFQEEDIYVGEFKVENEPNENGNRLRIYMESDCVIESIFIKEILN